MKSILFSLSIFLLWTGNTNDVSAQTPVLWIEDGVSIDGDNSYLISINLENLNEVGGFQFVMKYDTDIFSINSVNPTGRLSGIGLFTSETVPGQLSVVAISLTGDPILPGTGFVIQVNMILSDGAPPGASLLDLTDVIFTDLVGNTINAESADGYFFIQGANILRMENGFGMNDVILYNNIAIGGIQSNLQFDNNIISVADIVLTERSQHMTLEFQESKPGNISILIYDLSNGVISPGTQSILEITLNIPNDSTSIINPLVLQDLVLTDISGNIIESQSLSGNYINVLKIGSSLPIVANPIMDLVTNEDFGSISVANLNDVFTDTDLPNDSLRYSLSISSELITGSISGDTLWIFSVADSNGMAEVVVTATDDSSASVSDTFKVTIVPVGDNPFVMNPIMDIVADEDFGSIMVALLDTVFDDPDLPNDSLRYTFSISSGLITGNISGDSFWIFSVADSNGMAEVVVTATDDSSASVSDTFKVTIVPVVGIDEEFAGIPEEYDLYQNYPNPFNPSTLIKYALPKSSNVSLVIYNLIGQEVIRWNEQGQTAGYHQVVWNASNVASGIYFYHLQAGGFVQTRKLIYLK